jgi:hypothetical protein
VLADQLKFEPSRSGSRLDICNPKENDLMTTLLQPARQRGHWIDVAGAGKAKAPSLAILYTSV